MALNRLERRLAKKHAEITENILYRRLKKVPRHGTANTYEHSVRVAAAAEKLAKRFSVDRESAVRVGLLHDFCMENYHDHSRPKTHGGKWYCFYHPEDALENCRKEGIRLTRTEKDAILSHMFPLSLHLPKSRLGLVLTLADKKVAVEEGIRSAGEFISGCISRFMPGKGPGKGGKGKRAGKGKCAGKSKSVRKGRKGKAERKA